MLKPREADAQPSWIKSSREALYRNRLVVRLGRIGLGAALLLSAVAIGAQQQHVLGQRGAVATVHPLATQAALQAFQQGGNAVDATVAAALTLGVVDGHNSGIGGGCFLLIRGPDNKIIAIDGRETAPGGAFREMFLREGKADPELSQTGALAIGIPGSLAAYDYALQHFGRLKLADLLRPAAKLAAAGFQIDERYARRLAATAPDLRKFPEAKQIFLRRDGAPWKHRDLLRQPDLARSYLAIAEKGLPWFYQNEFPERVEKWMRRNGGLVTAKDFQEYQIKIREPVHSTYRGYDIFGFPPPSSGGVHVAQILNILEHFELSRYPAYSADSLHLIVESMKLAFADRAYWLGDPDFVKVPQGLLSKRYAQALAQSISMQEASRIEKHGPADQFDERFFGKHTTHFSAADADGYWVACTATVNTSFGSKVVIPGTGIIMNNQMDDFSAQPGAPNYFGLIGAEANAVAPGKRPLSSMSPTLVLKNGQPILSLGAAGGPTIISQTVLNLVNTLDYRMGVAEALARPRVHHQWKPPEVRAEALPEGIRGELEQRGHKVNTVSSAGAAQIIGRTEAGFVGAHDPRLPGKAGGL